MKANGCFERDIPSEKRIKAAIDVNIKKGWTLTVPHPNPTQIKFYKDIGGGFDVPDVEFFGTEYGRKSSSKIIEQDVHRLNDCSMDLLDGKVVIYQALGAENGPSGSNSPGVCNTPGLSDR